ncbi:pleckstrin homology domain-containing family J member 1 isoform X3 [Gopherus flavomarginatus]|uniref:pleckstrin homology domain-containing family J member 1 isoform X3 n=1 Tax=Gopherus flavomarginatus TaxID=286002 RepID=UPI0021CBDB8D|nr:pleckstrin homology domain-containing family J member 1 isoform X3 [Gopherus flavomarginatus]
MRYSERELLSLARQPAEKAAEILMRVPKKGSVLKKRLVKLVVNFLFYFRTDEAEPIGALLLEHCKITKEEENVFSISFIEEPDRKYSFECDTEEQCQEWIEALRRASYEFMRRSLIFYRNEIQKMTGKPPFPQAYFPATTLFHFIFHDCVHLTLTPQLLQLSASYLTSLLQLPPSANLEQVEKKDNLN